MQVETIEDIYVENADFWRSLEVSYDSIFEMNEKAQSNLINIILNPLSINDLKEIAEVFHVKYEAKDVKKVIYQKVKERLEDVKELLLLLNNFLRNKKRAIKIYYQEIFENKKYKTSIMQLFKLYQDSSDNLFSVLTYHYWCARSSGPVYQIGEDVDTKIANQILKEKSFHNKLSSSLKEASDNEYNYRLFSSVKFNETCFIVLVYKQVKDVSIADYSEAVRSKAVELLLFEINLDLYSVEIKTNTQYDTKGIKGYLEDAYGTFLIPHVDEVFKDYDKNKLLQTMTGECTASGKPVLDFLIDKIVFRSSPIKNSPEITLHTRNMDIWPSVIDAVNKETVDIQSIKDLRSISFKSANVTRTIKSKVKENGNVLFTMNDSKIDESVLYTIKNKFYEKFGLPLFQEISNNKFKEGQADLIDYVMGSIRHEKDEEENTIYNELLDKGLFFEYEVKYASCTNPSCPNQDLESDLYSDLETCPICDEEIRFTSEMVTEIEMTNVEKLLKGKIQYWCSQSNWKQHRDSKFTYRDNQLRLIKVERETDGDILQFLIADQNVDKKLLKKLHKMLTPLVVVFVGKQEKIIADYSAECIQAITFGNIYTQETKNITSFFDDIHKSLKLRAKNYIASGANKAYETIQQIVGEPEKINKKEYSSDDFEDDGYNLIKDIFNNSTKWGKEKIGKPMPEGVFSISFLKNKKQKVSYAFSFDFKLTYKNKGYPLNKSERRKAIDYVNNLNDTDSITSFTHLNELTGHIFISNRFMDNHIEAMNEHFEKHLEDSEVNTKPIFINVEMLAYLHERYREHIDLVELNKNYFFEKLYKNLMNKSMQLKKEHINQIFDDLLSRPYQDTDTLDMNRLTMEMEEEYL